MFYYDQTIRNYEREYKFDEVLTYLEKLYLSSGEVLFVNSIIGYAWYYVVEGPVDSITYNLDCCSMGIEMWKKYIKIGLKKFSNDNIFNFISGYTLIMHGFLIIDNTKKDFQELDNIIELGNTMLEKLKSDSDEMFVNLSKFLLSKSKKKVLQNSKEIKQRLFNKSSLLEQYFKEIL